MFNVTATTLKAARPGAVQVSRDGGTPYILLSEIDIDRLITLRKIYLRNETDVLILSSLPVHA